ncbi:hypothetical protein BpHYR1_020904 [Brachionus plicatilis]|uniref:Uncharacterized protein n=1 Tax=Brachionus plicatilis TaxID=10195 RepID=A0A3M7REB2_BRAPC|nr:hypothetical protein BpHYR1_020904 [Brachionus plicatilis]
MLYLKPLKILSPSSSTHNIDLTCLHFKVLQSCWVPRVAATRVPKVDVDCFGGREGNSHRQLLTNCFTSINDVL